MVTPRGAPLSPYVPTLGRGCIVKASTKARRRGEHSSAPGASDTTPVETWGAQLSSRPSALHMMTAGTVLFGKKKDCDAPTLFFSSPISFLLYPLDPKGNAHNAQRQCAQCTTHNAQPHPHTTTHIHTEQEHTEQNTHTHAHTRLRTYTQNKNTQNRTLTHTHTHDYAHTHRTRTHRTEYSHTHRRRRRTRPPTRSDPTDHYDTRRTDGRTTTTQDTEDTRHTRRETQDTQDTQDTTHTHTQDRRHTKHTRHKTHETQDPQETTHKTQDTTQDTQDTRNIEAQPLSLECEPRHACPLLGR